ncbi:hypothetical protein SeKA_A1591 [Salmonella enterica subsp. enterica serovar Kentucky str. CVM29188]|nr:hypothetical protein SeKA_A1591 [Salmonella enterica subsp. enterica serovar Kentucky str. CVM29188]EDZ22721.1 hypothetical protein SeKB_A2220 [Salmonella enterica subsp. enterica serovar Kentucky str. CDC 191]
MDNNKLNVNYQLVIKTKGNLIILLSHYFLMLNSKSAILFPRIFL